MTATKKKVVLLGCGTYNPPTVMHLRMFEVARDYMKKKLNYEEVDGIISPVNDNYRGITSKFVLDSIHRCNMVRLTLKPIGQSSPLVSAFSSSSSSSSSTSTSSKGHWIRLDDWEVRQDRWLRTLEVLRHHQEEINTRAQVDCSSKKHNHKIPLMLLCGSDLFDSFNTPGLWLDEDIEHILGDFGLIVITREGNDPWVTISNSPKSSIITKYKDNIIIIEDKVKNTVSSSYVRSALAAGESVRYLVDDAVIDYIYKNNLYGSKKL